MGIRDAILNEIENKPKGNNQGQKDVPTGVKSQSSKNGINKVRLKEHLDKLFYMRENLEETRAGLHCSHIIQGEGEFCYRSAVLSLLCKQNQGENLPARLMRIFAAGNSIHEKWQNFFDKLRGKKLKADLSKIGITQVGNEERSFSELYELYFTPDCKIITDWDMRKYVLEIKSMNMFAFKKAVKLQDHPKARKQLMMYMYLTGIRHGIILIECKNSQEYEIIFVDYDPEVIKPILARLYEVKDMKKAYILDRVLPPKKCQKCTSTRAKQCNMRDACYNMGIGRVHLKTHAEYMQELEDEV